MREEVLELQRLYDLPCVVLSRREYQRILNDGVVRKEKHGNVFMFHNGGFQRAIDLKSRPDVDHAPHSRTWESLEVGDHKDWNHVVALLQDKYNLPE